MKTLLLFSVLFSCTFQPNQQEDELVSLRSALMQAQASYLRGCVDAMKDLKVPLAFHGCRDMSILHGQEVNHFLDRY